MNTRVRWTKEEDEILVQSIKNNPQNKLAAFREVAIKTDHSVASCSARWYNILNNPYNKYYIGSMFTIIRHNPKCDSIKSTIITKVNIWTKIKNYLFKIK